MNFLNTSRTSEAIKLVSSDGHAYYAVAFWGRNSLFSLGLEGDNRGRRVICNLAMGGTNPDVIRELMESGAQVRHNDRLHSKVYGNSRVVVLGSSNASQSGLGLNNLGGWHEANVILNEAQALLDIQRWFEHLWNNIETRDVDEAALKKARLDWTYNEKHKGPPRRPTRKKEFFEIIRDRPEHFYDQNIHVAIYRERGTELTDKRLSEVQEEVSKLSGPSDKVRELGYFHEWPGLPKGADIISFFLGPNGGLSYDGVWETFSEPWVVTASDGSQLHLCQKSSMKLAVSKGRKFIARWVSNAIAREFPEEDAGVMPIEDFVRLYVDFTDLG
ncbi:hypothetical protein TH5_00445 [Thalassospira xianhensis MCCC 1A02616]|uniref:Phospholipase D-like domain-containing protein n=2 Tax=Thalassospira xianhensis TaxID=478503 RepID=A0A367UH03_9PROT|nr:hypothetical protein TH5_00445 [Thalassospira xianhensis MCCC 1A02616]